MCGREQPAAARRDLYGRDCASLPALIAPSAPATHPGSCASDSCSVPTNGPLTLVLRCACARLLGIPCASQWNFFYVFLGAFFWQYLTPPVAQCAEFRLSWMALIVARNVSFLWIWVGALHQLLYVWHVVPDKLKFNPSYPKKQQHYRDFLMSTSGALIDSAMQIGFMHLYATNKVPWYPDFWAGPQWAQQLGSWQGPAFSIAMILVGCLYQDFHFYWVHRYIHRWGWVRRLSPPRRPAAAHRALRALR